MAFLALQEEAIDQQLSVYKLRRRLFRQEVPTQPVIVFLLSIEEMTGLCEQWPAT